MTMTGWYQESGRAGRDGAPARSVVYYTAEEERTMVDLAKQPPEGAKSADDKRAAVAVSRREANAVVAACREPCCRRAAMLKHFGEERAPARGRGPVRCAPTGGGGPGGAAGCDACADRDAAARGAAAMAMASCGSREMLAHLRSAAPGDIDLSEFEFGAPVFHDGEDDDFRDDEDDGSASDDDDGDGSGWAMGGDAAHAADVACYASGGARGGAVDDAELGRTMDALERAEQGAKSSGRSGLGAALFAHRRPAAAAPAPPLPPRSVDEAARATARAKLQAAMGARDDAAAAAAAAEAKVFALYRERPTLYSQHLGSAVLDAQRAASKPAAQQPRAPAGGAVRAPLALAPTSRTFVPPRAAVAAPPRPPAPPPAPPAAAAPAAPPKLKSTHIGGPMDAFLRLTKRPKADA
jgi:hypothetical protein